MARNRKKVSDDTRKGDKARKPGNKLRKENEAEQRPGMKRICVAYVTSKSGRRIYASNYGKKAFCFWVKDE